MPQGILPLFAEDTTPINRLISFKRKEGMVYYFHGWLPIQVRAIRSSGRYASTPENLYHIGWACAYKIRVCGQTVFLDAISWAGWMAQIDILFGMVFLDIPLISSLNILDIPYAACRHYA